MSSRYMQPLRILTQFTFLGFMVWLVLCFYNFVQIVSSPISATIGARPDGVDGFLPISGLLGTASWFKGGGINTIHPAAVVVFLTVIAVSLLLRRSFCSWICPVATVSECAWKAGFKLLRRNWRIPAIVDVPLRMLKYVLMAFFIYGIAIAMNSNSLKQFIDSDYHKIADVRLMNFFLHMSPVAFAFILTITLCSFVLRNPFCRYLCPYGALLGLVAVLSPLRISRNSESCISCGACSQVCPAYIDVMHQTTVISPECIACWRCVSHCRFNNALSMNAFQRFAIPGFIFAILVVTFFYGGTVIGTLSGHWHSQISLEEYGRLLHK
ncbi:MAG TPA: 4Fe-4S binding protein [Desulfuromonadales bacterium]|nr:4Fe-4S binding protein [Desulfuromonadales bacterium]